MDKLGALERELTVPADEPYIGGLATERTDLENIPAALSPNPAGGADLQWTAPPNSVSLLVLQRK